MSSFHYKKRQFCIFHAWVYRQPHSLTDKKKYKQTSLLQRETLSAWLRKSSNSEYYSGQPGSDTVSSIHLYCYYFRWITNGWSRKNNNDNNDSNDPPKEIWESRMMMTFKATSKLSVYFSSRCQEEENKLKFFSWKVFLILSTVIHIRMRTFPHKMLLPNNKFHMNVSFEDLTKIKPQL